MVQHDSLQRRDNPLSRLRSPACHRRRLFSGSIRQGAILDADHLLQPSALRGAGAFIGQASAGETRARQILDRFEHANQWRDHVMVAAHRAGSMQAGKTLYAENSLAAVEGSIAIGAEIVEVDIRRSKDGEFVVMHDSWLDRTTNCKGEVVELHAGRTQDAAGWWSKAPAPSPTRRFPTLREMLTGDQGPDPHQPRQQARRPGAARA